MLSRMRCATRIPRTRFAIALLAATAAGCAAPREPGDAASAAAESSRPLLRFRFRTAEDGPPAAGAAVRWTLDLRPARDPATAGRISGTGTTDSEGRFSMPAPAEEGYFAIWVRSDGRFQLAESWIHHPATSEDEADEPEPDTVLRAPDTQVRIRVADRHGDPIAGARLVLVIDDEGAPIPDAETLVSDARGEIRHGPIEHENYWFDLEAPGFAPLRKATYQFPIDADASEVQTVTLHPGVTLRGMVLPVDSDGLPEGARARVAWTHPGTRDQCEWFVPMSANGRFECIVPVDVEVAVSTEAPGRDVWTHTTRVVWDTGKSQGFPLRDR